MGRAVRSRPSRWKCSSLRRIAYPVSARQSGSAADRWLRLHRHPYPIYAEIRRSPVASFAGSALPESIWQTLIAKSGRSAIVRPPATLYLGVPDAPQARKTYNASSRKNAGRRRAVAGPDKSAPVAQLLGWGHPPYPDMLLARLGTNAPSTLTAIGPVALLAHRRTALFCSAHTPGDAILRAHDVARRIREGGGHRHQRLSFTHREGVPPHSAARQAADHHLPGTRHRGDAHRN